MTAPIYHQHIEQNTPEWYEIKAGKWSASNAAVIMGGLDTSGLDSLIKTIAWERVFGPANEDRFRSGAMDRGHEIEPEAREWAAFNADTVIEQMGFVEHGEIANVGWSPDGLYAKRRRGIEAKCPLHKAFMDMLRTGKVPPEYRWQARWACWVGQLESLDFIGYHPSAGGICIPVEMTEAECQQMGERVSLLEKRVEPWIDILSSRKVA